MGCADEFRLRTFFHFTFIYIIVIICVYENG